jgi:hypothetical protein
MLFPIWAVGDFEPNVQVLFRNNFAISRDIAGLFQSFQSSSTILDPESNPSLFCSRLVIIIKVDRLAFLGLHIPQVLTVLL